MSTFVLVHGAWQGAWCWEQVTPELEAHGHQVVTMDLPSDDPSATFQTYADVVTNLIDATTAGDVVLVGHSLAGHTIPIVANQRRVKRLVYLCALTAVPGASFVDQLTTDPDMINPAYATGLGDTDANGLRAWVNDDLAREFLYADCAPDVAAGAVERMRPQAQTPYVHACPIETYADIPSTYVVCGEDRLVNPAWSRRIAIERLSADLIEMPGSHSPFASRPSELAALLHELA